MARGLRPLTAVTAPWPPASALGLRGRGPTAGSPAGAGGEERSAEGDEAGEERGEGDGVTRRVQGPGEGEFDASREGL